ncbi:hypothetical protein TNCV_3117761 [Trichonephila clavipes]|uniref:Uncharacterized protein n=1 Tax=Trichonephila clavipes TaxID=2585209 RepID=A0A8X6WA04_TRICX|nr:hypothetical protein TNCV_3117761 [Trichonephila clavipes]
MYPDENNSLIIGPHNPQSCRLQLTTSRDVGRKRDDWGPSRAIVYLRPKNGPLRYLIRSLPLPICLLQVGQGERSILLVVSLKRDPQCLSPQASLVLLYQPTAVRMKGFDLSQPKNRTRKCDVEAQYATTRPLGLRLTPWEQ